jgi:hypothetical protein
MTVRGHVTKGRLIVDEPTDLPEGTEVELVSVDDRGRAERSSSAPDIAPVWGDVTDEELDAFLTATASARLVDELRGGDESRTR